MKYNKLKMNKAEQLSKLSEELLSDLEGGMGSLEQSVLRATKLARLHGDSDAHKWLRLEINGYDPLTLPADITRDEALRLATRSNRTFKWTSPATKETTNRWITDSVASIESEISACEASLQHVTMPTHVTPSNNAFQNESYTTVLNNVTTKQSNIRETIKRNKSYLAKIRSGIYNYVFTIYSTYTFENVADTIFSQIKSEVDDKLQILVPDALSQLTAAFNRLRDGDGEDLSQALSTCRNILNAFANAVYPARKGTVKLSDDTKLSVGENSYKNRIIAFIDEKTVSKSDAKLTIARAHDLAGRLTQVHRVLSKGAKNTISKGEAQRYVIETYMLLGTLLEYIPEEKSLEA